MVLKKPTENPVIEFMNVLQKALEIKSTETIVQQPASLIELKQPQSSQKFILEQLQTTKVQAAQSMLLEQHKDQIEEEVKQTSADSLRESVTVNGEHYEFLAYQLHQRFSNNPLQ